MAAVEAARPRERTVADEEAELREVEAPMATGDAIERMLLAWKDRDYFRRALLNPQPLTLKGAPCCQSIPFSGEFPSLFRNDPMCSMFHDEPLRL